MTIGRNDRSSSPTLEFRILGNVEVWGKSESLVLGGLKQRMVLAMLIAESNRVISVDELIDGLWGDSPPRRAVGTLQAYVSNLRRVLEPDRTPGAPAMVLVSRPPGYVLNVHSDAVDSVHFERLADAGRQALVSADHRLADRQLSDALGLWRGPTLAEFRYEPFAQKHITFLERRKLDALEDLFEARIELGRHAEVVADLERLVSEHPTRERLRAELMIALYRSGRQVDALRAYEEVRATLSEELGVDPSAELRDLHDRIVRQDASLDGSAMRQHAPSTRVPERIVDEGRDDRPLVGRAFELASLGRALARSRHAAAAIVLIEGEAGIGKTRVADVIAEQASEQGFCVLRGFNDEDDVAPSYLPWMQIIRSLEEVHPEVAVLPDRTRRALGLVTTTDRTQSDAERSIDGGWRQVNVADDVSDVLLAVADAQPLLVVQEDIHWADAGSLAVLESFCRRIDSSRVLVVATCRSVDGLTSPGVVETLASIARLGYAERIVLTGLATDEIRDLVTATTGITPSARVAEAIHKRTDGNAFFVSELIALLSAERHSFADDADRVTSAAVPGGVRDVVRQRIARLPDDTRHLLAAAAVTGREFELDVVFAASDLQGDRALEATEAALLGRVIEDTPFGGGRYAFSHALVRETLLDDIGAIGRARLHGRIADALLTKYGDEGDHLVDAAWHMWRSAPTRPREQMAPYLVRAGEVALARTDFENADALLSRAADALRSLPPTPERDDMELRVRYQLALVRGRTLGSGSDEVRESVSRMQELSRKLARPAELVHALWFSFSNEIVGGDAVRASDIARRMIVEAERSQDATALALACASSGLAGLERGDLAGAREYLQRGIRFWRERYGDVDPIVGTDVSLFDPRAYRPDVMCLGYGAIVAWLEGDTAQALDTLLRALTASPGGAGGHAYPLAFTMYCRAWLDALRRDHARATRDAEEAVRFARTRGLKYFTSAGLIVGGWAAAVDGDVERGLRMIEEGFAEDYGALGGMRRPWHLALYAEAVWQSGDARGARALIGEAIDGADRMGSNRYILPELYRLRGLLMLDDDSVETDEAQRSIARAVDEARRQGSVELERRAARDLDAIGPANAPSVP